MSIFIVGLSGLQGAGKSYLASKIKKEIGSMGLNCIHISLAEPIYQFCKIILGKEVCKNEIYKIGINDPLELSGRKILQYLGTEIGRNFHDEIWIWMAKNKIESALPNGGIAIVDDVRFPNERNTLCDFSIWIDVENGLVPEQESNHKSEQYLSELKSLANFRIKRMANGNYCDEIGELDFQDVASIVTTKYQTLHLPSALP